MSLATVRRVFLNPAVAFVEDYKDILHYYKKTERLLRLRQQWHATGKCPRSILLSYLFVVSFWLHLSTVPYLQLFSVDPMVQFLFGNITPLFGLTSSFVWTFFFITLPVPLYHLLMYPYLGTKYYDSLLFPKWRICRQLSLSAAQRDRIFHRFYKFYQASLYFFLLVAVVSVIIISLRVLHFTLDRFEYFFATWGGWLRLLCLVLSMSHMYALGVYIIQILCDMLVSFYYSSVFTFADLDRCQAKLQRAPFSFARVRHFARVHTGIVTRVLRMNNITGNVLVLYYVANYPTNAYMLILLCVRRNLSLVIKLAIVAFMLQQHIFLVGVHLLAASYGCLQR